MHKQPMNQKRRRIEAELILTHPWSFVAFGFGSGLSPIAPGTVGTLVAIPIFLAASLLSPWLYTLTILALFIFGTIACSKAQIHLKVSDHSGIVFDEVVGFLVSMAFTEPGLVSITEGFLLFRAFDILKPWPIRWLDRHVHGGLGVMLDDVVAGVFTALILPVLNEPLSFTLMH